jgi:hypothetical protein
MINKPTWFVWCPTGWPPKHQHQSIESAINEAERLAKAHPGQQFVVLETVGARMVDLVQRIDLRPVNEPDEIPF